MKTEVYKVDPQHFQPADLDAPAQILADGGLVAFPTETVYGIGANAHKPEAVHALRKVKDRSDDKPLSLHIADRDEVSRLVSEIPHLATTLMDLYWPGPLTIVFPGHAGAGIGIRLPSHPIARELIRRSRVPVLAPSANRRGEPPAVTSEEVFATFAGEIHALVDGGSVSIRQASTVVRVRGDDFEILRQGLVTEAMIHRALGGRYVIFVCTGNSCRSPMAEVMFKQLLAERLQVSVAELPEHGYRIASAGTLAFGGGSASRHAMDLMEERGFDLSQHRSRPLSPPMAEEAQLIIALGLSHQWHLESWNPRLASKVELISEAGILDPIGGSVTTYRECAAEIEKALKDYWLDRVIDL